MKIGDRVLVNENHQYRGRQRGTIVDSGAEDLEILNPPPGRYCIKFDNEGVGINRRYLFLSERDFVVVDE